MGVSFRLPLERFTGIRCPLVWTTPNLGCTPFGPPLCGGIPPATPPYATHPVHSSPATCLANRVSTPTRRLQPLTTDHRPPTTAVLCGRAFGPPLCGGIPPATPPYATHPVHSSPATCLANRVSTPTRRLQPLTTDHCSSHPRVATVGAGLVPARYLPKSRRQTASATAAMNAPPGRSHPKSEMRPRRSPIPTNRLAAAIIGAGVPRIFFSVTISDPQ